MPKMGESITEATILTWLKKPGDKIEQDESVLEVATDKVDTEVPSTHAGVLKEILAKEGEVVKVGTAIAILTTDVPEETSKPAPSPTPDGRGVKNSETNSHAPSKAVQMTTQTPATNGVGHANVPDYKSACSWQPS